MPLPRENDSKIAKIPGQIYQTWNKASLRKEDLCCSNKGPCLFPMGDNSYMVTSFEGFVQMIGHAPFKGEIITTLNQPACGIIVFLRLVYCMEMVSLVSIVACRPLVLVLPY